MGALGGLALGGLAAGASAMGTNAQYRSQAAAVGAANSVAMQHNMMQQQLSNQTAMMQEQLWRKAALQQQQFQMQQEQFQKNQMMMQDFWYQQSRNQYESNRGAYAMDAQFRNMYAMTPLGAAVENPGDFKGLATNNTSPLGDLSTPSTARRRLLAK